MYTVQSIQSTVHQGLIVSKYSKLHVHCTQYTVHSTLRAECI